MNRLANAFLLTPFFRAKLFPRKNQYVYLYFRQFAKFHLLESFYKSFLRNIFFPRVLHPFIDLFSLRNMYSATIFNEFL